MTDRAPLRQRSLLRLVQVLLVAAGLIAMHQMGGGAHRMVLATPAATVMTVSGAAGHPPAAHGMLMTGPAGRPDPRDVAVSAAADVVAALTEAPGRAMAGMGVCLAVLLGLLVAAPRRPWSAANPASGPVQVPGRHDSVALGRGPPRLLLAKLCVLRT